MIILIFIKGQREDLHTLKSILNLSHKTKYKVKVIIATFPVYHLSVLLLKQQINNLINYIHIG